MTKRDNGVQIDEVDVTLLQEPEFQALADNHRAFVIAYCGIFGTEGVWNASEAARRAGYKNNKNVRITAHRLTQRPDVRAAINKFLAVQRAQWSELLHAVVAELVCIGFSSATDVVEVEDGRVRIKDTADMPLAARRAISEVVEMENKEGSNLRVKMHSKVDALKLLAKITGGIVDRHAGPDGEQPIGVSAGLSRDGVNQLFRCLGMPQLPEQGETG